MRKIVLLVGVAVFFAGVWLLFGSAPTDVLPAGSAEDRTTGDLELDPAGLGRDAVAEETVAEDREAAAERTVVEVTDASSMAEPKPFRILVTEKESGDPVPGAKVSYFDSSALLYNEMSRKEQEEYGFLASDMEKLTRHYGKELIADSEGVAYVPTGEQSTYLQIVGRHDELYGQLSLNTSLLDEEDDQEFQLELEPDRVLQVQVLDSIGNPAIGVSLGIWPEGLVENAAYFAVAARSEAPDGVAKIAHLQVRVLKWQRQGEAGSDYVVQARIPGLKKEGPAFNVVNPPEDPLVLQLQPTGSIVVKTTDADGGILQTPFGVSLATPPDPRPENLNSYNPPPMQQWQEQPEEDGSILFERVVAGKSFLVSAYFNLESIKEIHAGPLREGHEVRVTLTPKTKSYRVAGLAMNADHDPIANKRLRAVFAINAGSARSRNFVTDSEGRFSVSVGREGKETTLERFSLMFETYGQASDKSTAMYSLPGSMPLVLGKNDLGEVTLGESPLVASGRILVDGQVPDREHFGLHVERLQVQQRGNKTTENWSSDRAMNLKFSKGGRFEIHGESQPERYRVKMEWYGGGGSRLDYLPLEPVEFAPGAKDLQIDLESGGSLYANLLGSHSINSQHLWLRVVPTDGKIQEEESDPRYQMQMPWGHRLYGQYSGEHEGQETYKWGALGAGSYKLEILPRGARSPLLTVEDIEIVAGERNKDPRLNPIDLEGLLRKFKIVLQDRDGRRIPNGNWGPPVVIINDPSAETELQGYAAQNGSTVILTAEQSVDLLVVARGYQPRELYGVREDQTVVLDPYPEVVVRVVGGLTDLPKDHSLRVSLSKKGRAQDKRKLMSDWYMGGSMTDWLNPSTMQQAVDSKGEVSLQVNGEGLYSVQVMLQNNKTYRSASVSGFEPTKIEVRASADGQVFAITLPEEGLKKALERTSKKR